MISHLKQTDESTDVCFLPTQYILWFYDIFLNLESLWTAWHKPDSLRGWMEINGLFDPQKIINFFSSLALKEKVSSNVFQRESALAGGAKSASS